ncbi:SAM-dependent methyltransferase [Actinoplanes teichomyceticus]|uniref:SAM-dependent MidA family methyltransferase n=1 Tax=Actinoplanes teichomyceticus TaxID=1867 RepID=A0A561WQJ1_ACTTI|nr:SAM-dependent methyltransferase [Actinoplanes teichomyceticus]TWG26124.1 SAM-dependent MidA family methyltransferase [Actinoplanes teichomyceticus]
MQSALYGPDGFFVRPRSGPADHFRTSVHASPLFAEALLRLVERVDVALGHPARFDLVDVGAGRGELLGALCARLPAGLAARVRPVAVELAQRPDRLPPEITWRRDVPETVTGLLLATEWLDNVPLDIVETDERGRLRKVLVDRAGRETLGAPADPAEVLWSARWWPGPGRIEIGAPRDAAWADAVNRVRRGAALCVDYGHRRDERPAWGTLAGFRGGRQVTPVPDGDCDVTAHVAMDSVAGASGLPYQIVRQRDALRALGISGARPPLSLASSDPAAYLRALSSAGAAAELTAPGGLGAHWWLWQPVGLDLPLR